MPKVLRKVSILVPADQVFAALDDPKSLPLMYYCVCDVCDFRPGERHVGEKFRGRFSVVGLKFDLDFVCTEHTSSRSIVERFEGAMNGRMAFAFESQGDTTSVTLELEYEISRDFLGTIANRALFEQMAVKNAERVLENLKIIAEAMAASPQAPPGADRAVRNHGDRAIVLRPGS